jgi:DNA-binding transcriptional LysR family regulator
MLDDLNELKTFQRVLALGSLSAAARDMGIGLAVVSKRLSTLERRAGLRLINRTTRSLSATEEGKSLLAHVERVLEDLAVAEGQLQGGRADPQGVVRVAAPISFGRLHIAPIAATLTHRFPKLQFDLRFEDRLVDVIDERLDLAIRIGVAAPSRFTVRKLADNRRILAASPAYLDQHGRPQDPEALSGHAFLRYDERDSPWRLEGPEGAIASIPAACRLRANSGDVVHDWAVAGEGIMFKSWVDVAPDFNLGRLEQILPAWGGEPAPVYALFPSGRMLAPKVRVFVEEVALRVRRQGL